MGISFSVQDGEGALYNLNDSAVGTIARESLTTPATDFTVDTDIIRNSYLAGDVKVGDSRLSGRQLAFTLERAEDNDEGFRTAVNTLIKALYSSEYLIDGTTGLRMRVSLDSVNIGYNTGGFLRSSSEGFVFNCLTPYWEEDTENETVIALTADDEEIYEYTNDGFIDLSSILEITYSTAATYFQVVLNNQVIRINDTLIGTESAYSVLTIDNVIGRILLGTLDRTPQIEANTGFINFPVGTYFLKILTDGNASLTIKDRKRFYV